MENSTIIQKCYDDAMNRTTLVQWIRDQTGEERKRCQSMVLKITNDGLLTKVFSEFWPTDEGMKLIKTDPVIIKAMHSDIPTGHEMGISNYDKS